MVSNNYVVKTEGDKPLDLKALQEVVKEEISQWGEEIDVDIFLDPVKIPTKIPELKPLNIARIIYKNGCDSVLVTEVNESNVRYVNDPVHSHMIPFYLIEVGIPKIPDPALPMTPSMEKILIRYMELAQKIKQEVSGIECLTFV